MPAGLHCLRVGGMDYWQDVITKCGRHGMAGSVTEVRSHDKGKGGRSVTVHRSVTGVKNQSVTEGMENEWAWKSDKDMACWFTRMYGVFLRMRM